MLMTMFFRSLPCVRFSRESLNWLTCAVAVRQNPSAYPHPLSLSRHPQLARRRITPRRRHARCARASHFTASGGVGRPRLVRFVEDRAAATQERQRERARELARARRADSGFRHLRLGQAQGKERLALWLVNGFAF